MWRYFSSGITYTPDLDVTAAAGETLPGQWISPTFDDSSWSVGATPFGEQIICSALSAYVSGPIGTSTSPGPQGATDFPRNTLLFVRSHFWVNSQAGFSGSALIIADNNILGVYVNGNPLITTPLNRGCCNDGDCGAGIIGVTTPVTFPIPSSVVVNGDNVIAIKVQDQDGSPLDGTGNPYYGNQSFLDVELAIDTVYPTGASTLGGTSDTTCICFQPTPV